MSLEFYRTNSAIVVIFVSPKYDNNGFVTKNGSLLFKAALGKDKSFKWTEKNQFINFSIFMSDLPSIFVSFLEKSKTGKMDLRLVHDPHVLKEVKTDEEKKDIKNFTITTMDKRERDKTTSHYLNISNGHGIKIGVALSEGELYMLKILFEQSLKTMLGF